MSVVYFGAPFGRWHWVGAGLVFVGTVLYSLPSGGGSGKGKVEGKGAGKGRTSARRVKAE